MSDNAAPTRKISGKLVFLATADLTFEIPADTPDDQLREALGRAIEATDPVEKLQESANVDYVKSIGFQSEDPAIMLPIDEEIEEEPAASAATA